jgi:hypothetical protein
MATREIWLRADIVDRLEALALERGLSLDELIRSLLDDYENRLKEERERKHGSDTE